MFTQETLELINIAIREDLGTGDVTTKALIAPELIATAKIIAKEDLLVCGHEVVKLVLKQFSSDLSYQIVVADGERVNKGAVLSYISGSFAKILQAERVLLNFLQHLSGVATVTASLVQKIKHTSAKILDTRKTSPGLRELEKYAVRIAGGENHRFGLFDMFLIKNNHIDALGGDIKKAIALAKENNPKKLKIEVEVRNLVELKNALEETPDIVMFDNMNCQQIREGILILRKSDPQAKIKTEASGNINTSNIVEYAETGVDYISLGMITHSVKAADISLRYDA